MNKDKQEPKPFPWKCGSCSLRSVVPTTVPYDTELYHDGRTYSVHVPDLEVPRCDKCGEMILDDAANRRISAAFRQQLGLLTPEQVRGNRQALGLTQKQLAKDLSIAEATLSRWETGGQIQQRSLDKLLRLYFDFPEVRLALSDERSVPVLCALAPVQAVGSAMLSVRADLQSRLGDLIRWEQKEQARGHDTERAVLISRLAAALGQIPDDKAEAAVEQFERLAELMQPCGPAER